MSNATVATKSAARRQTRSNVRRIAGRPLGADELDRNMEWMLENLRRENARYNNRGEEEE